MPLRSEKKAPERPGPFGCSDEGLNPLKEEELFWVAGIDYACGVIRDWTETPNRQKPQ